MTRIITIETPNDSAFEQIKILAYKLGAKMREEPLTEPATTAKGKTEVEKYLAHRRKNPPVKIPKDFDFNAVVDSGINL